MKRRSKYEKRNRGTRNVRRIYKIGAYLKIMCNVAVTASTVIAGDFNKTNPLHRRMERISKELEQLRSDLEDSMPYGEISRLCEEKGINPIDIFYDSSSIYEPNRQQTQLIYDCFLKNILESEED